MDERLMDELLKTLRAVLLAQLEAGYPIAQRRKPEVLLSRAGFSSREIAHFLGKGSAAVIKTLQRAGKAA